MDASPANGLLGTLQAQQDWPRLAEAAQRLANSQPNNGEAWRYWGIAEMMLMRGGPDKLLRASLLNDFESGLWLGVIQEFATHPTGDVLPSRTARAGRVGEDPPQPVSRLPARSAHRDACSVQRRVQLLPLPDDGPPGRPDARRAHRQDHRRPQGHSIIAAVQRVAVQGQRAAARQADFFGLREDQRRNCRMRSYACSPTARR